MRPPIRKLTEARALANPLPDFHAEQARPQAETPHPARVLQRMATDPSSLRGADILALQGVLGNRVVQRLLAQRAPRKGRAPSAGGLPSGLRAGIEGLSGLPMGDVRVHYDSDKPYEVGAAAFTAHTDIHVAPGEEVHLPHEAWHVVQQKQGRVAANTRVGGVDINNDPSLEGEADRMGQQAKRFGASAREGRGDAASAGRSSAAPAAPVRQL